ncbi:MAG: YfhO family protein [Ignavibacteria bacterium]|nr:YfhO family protein [Ignavibacteria bacterium]
MAKSKISQPPVSKTKYSYKSVFDNVWICLGILFLFWLIFFREIILGEAFIFDDFVHQFYPQKFMLSYFISNGIFPFWNPYSFGGMPFFAHIEIAVLYPLNLLMTLFMKNGYLSPVPVQISIVFHHLFASVGAFLLGRQMKLNNFVSLLFGLLFAYSSYMMIHAMHMANISGVSYLPFLFLFWFKFIDTKKYFNIFVASGLMALCILAGYPQVAFFNYLILFLFALSYIVKLYLEKDFILLKHIIFGFIIFVALPFGVASVQLLPTNEFVSLSNRASFDYEFAKQGSLHWYDFITAVMPKVFGVWSWNQDSGDIEYWATHQEGSWMFSIANVFVSALVLILLIPAIRVSVKNNLNKFLVIFLSVFSALVLMFALGGNFFFHKLLYDLIPVFNRFRNPGHILYLYMFCASFIAVLGLDALIKDKKKFNEFLNLKYLGVIAGIFLFFLVLILAGVFKSGERLSNPQIYGWVTKQYLIFFLFFAAFIINIYLLLKDKIKFNVFAVLITLILALEIYVIWFEQNNGSINPEKLYSQNSQAAADIKEQLKSEQFRVNMRYGSNMIFQRNQGMLDRIPLIEGYGALLLNKYFPPQKSETDNKQVLDLLNVKYKIEIDNNAKSMKFVENTGYFPRARMFYEIKVIENEEQLVNYMKSPEYVWTKTLVLEKSPSDIQLPAVVDSNISSEVKLLDYNINGMKFEVNTSENGFLFVSEVFYPAWKAYINGNPVETYRADYCLRAVYVEKGKHTVEMKYESDTFSAGLKISVIAVVILVAGLVFTGIRFKKNKPEEIQE